MTKERKPRIGKAAPTEKKNEKTGAANSTRRMGVEGSKVREQFIDAAIEILRSEGYPGLSARQVAAKAGLKTQLLYYYFLTMDDLILAVVRRVNDRRLQRFKDVMAMPQPLQALWEMMRDPSSAAVSVELTSIATHRETIRAEIVRSAKEFRTLQFDSVTRLLGDRAGADVPAAGLVMIAIGLGRSLISESALGLTDGHAEAIAIVDRVLADLTRKL